MSSDILHFFEKNVDNCVMNTAQISFRLPTELLEAIDALAKREMRTRTNMIEFMLMTWIREHEPTEVDDDGKIMR